MKNLLCIGFTAVAELLLLCSFSHAQVVHAVLIADTNDASIGPGAQNNLAEMQLLLAKAKNARLTVSETDVTGSGFSCSAIDTAITNLQVKGGDVVIVYYSGHGYRGPRTASDFPEFDCSRGRGDTQVGFADVKRVLKSKAPRFAIIVSDACNQPPAPQPKNFNGESLLNKTTDTAETAAGLRHLLIKYSGFLSVTGAKPGDASWYQRDGAMKGGFFTNQLMDSIAIALRDDGPKADWRSLLAIALKPITVPTQPQPTVQSPEADLSDIHKLD